ncbi:MAG: 1-deoxy-D-xylulose-5-phosphate reductoisomerase, partial [Clostridia bacterium]|nr:1-deoxy-D-xylulose-5-phosphate reductoisomerase [Clostridia bacterium]
PIQYAITYPRRFPMSGNELDFSKYSSLTFEKPDIQTFSALRLAYEAGRMGGIMPCIFNSADEAAVEMFLSGKFKYLQISEAIEYAMSMAKPVENPTIEQILEADKWARNLVYDMKCRS